MNTYFIRHNSNKLVLFGKKDSKSLEKTKIFINELRKKHKIGIDFDNKPWNDVFDHGSPKDSYFKDNPRSEYKRALIGFHDMATNGAYVFAEYDGLLDGDKMGCLLGKITPGKAKVEPFGIPEVTLEVTLQMEDVWEIPYGEFPVLSAIRPPYVTITECNRTWPDFAKWIYTKESLIPTNDLLHHSMAEQMCEEYLRRVGIKNEQGDTVKLDYCFLKVGKTMPAVDIVGRLVGGEKIFAQVKNGKFDKVAEKRFKQFVTDVSKTRALKVIFATNDPRVAGIQFIHIDEVFKYFRGVDEKIVWDFIGFHPKNVILKRP